VSDNGNYWIRTVAADGCKGFEDGNEPDERQGILRYEPVSTEVPQTWRDNWTKDCTDEKYDKLEPVLPWSIPPVKLHESQSAPAQITLKPFANMMKEIGVRTLS
jgi:hypothetical protein